MRDHGGSLARAAAMFPHAPAPWLDLSTGINPHSYPLFDLPATAYQRLPEEARIGELVASAARAYGAAAVDHVVAAPGTQILLPLVASLVAPGPAMVLSPTYAEHARTAALAEHRVEAVTRFEQLFEAKLAIVVNPNNPDGRIVERAQLLELAAHLAKKDGLLVVDEAFMDVGPRGESVAGDVGQGGVVVLRSFGKFFGLAGLRLGFAIASSPVAERLAAWFGPWAVSGSALEIGLRALNDLEWQDAVRETLQEEAERLDHVLSRHGLQVFGGTDLFRYLIDSRAPDLFDTLGKKGIVLRSFSEMPDALRVGLPGGEAEFDRLDVALQHWRRQDAG